MVMSVAVRHFLPSDYGEARTLWAVTPGVGLSTADQQAPIEQFLKRNPGLSFVAVNEGSLVGTILCGHDGRRGSSTTWSQRKATGERAWVACCCSLVSLHFALLESQSAICLFFATTLRASPSGMLCELLRGPNLLCSRFLRRVASNPSLEPTRYGSRGLAAPGHGADGSSEVNSRLPSRAA